MKKVLTFVVLILIILGVFYFIYKREAVAPAVIPPENTEPIVTASTIQANVEKYLRDNIVKLSPAEAVLGGTWYVFTVTTNLEENSGVVEYEDGHISEKRNFTYTTDENGEVTSLIIQ